MQAHEDRLAQVRQSLEGLSVGNALGGRFEMASPAHMRCHLEINSMPPPRRFVDDTNIALSKHSILRQYRQIDQDALAHAFGSHFEPARGYGLGARKLLSRIQNGQSWCDLTLDMFGGTGSFGNGSAM